MRAALKHLAPIALLAVAPCAATAWWVLDSVHHGSLGVDFRAELYPEATGLAVGVVVALKLFLWPLLLWLAVRGRVRAALLGGALSALSLLLVLPFTSLSAYVRLLNRLGDTFTHESYNLPGLLLQSGAAGVETAKIAGYALGLVVLAVACRRRSFALTIAASILLSPIVWLHDLELLALPLAAAWKRLSLPWLLPLGLFAVQGTPREVRERHIVVALVVIAAVALVAELASRSRRLALETS